MGEFGKKLKEFAKTKGGVKHLAEIVGIAQPQLSQYINGSREPGKAILEKIRLAGCDMNWLLGDDEKKTEVINDKNVLDEVVNMSKEFEKLKEEMKDLKEMHGEQALKIRSLEKTNDKLTEENQQLQEENKVLRDRIASRIKGSEGKDSGEAHRFE